MIPFIARHDSIDTAASKSDIVAGLPMAKSCILTRKLSGEYTLELTLPIDAAAVSELNTQDCFVYVGKPTEQVFKVNRIRKTLTEVQVFAVHPAYALSGIALKPFSASGAPSTVINSAWNNWSTGAKSMFRVSSTMTNVSPASTKIAEPTTFREFLQGIRGSMVDTFGGFIDYGLGVSATGSPAYAVTHKPFPTTGGIEIFYHINMTDYFSEEDSDSYYRGVIPYWSDGNTGTWGNVVYRSGALNYGGVKWIDISDQYESAPTAAQFQVAAQNYLNANVPDAVTVTIETGMYKAAQYARYGSGIYASDIQIGQPVTIIIPERGLNLTSKTSGFTYDLLNERFTNIEIDNIKKSLGALLAQLSKKGGVAL